MNKKLLMLAVVVSLVAVPLVATADSVYTQVSKEDVSGGWSCPGEGQKIDSGAAVTQLPFDFDGSTGWITIVVNPTTKEITFTTDNPAHVVDTVLVKGGRNALLWHFTPGVQEATVHAPENPRNEKYYGVSNLCFLTDKKPLPST